MKTVASYILTPIAIVLVVSYASSGLIKLVPIVALAVQGFIS